MIEIIILGFFQDYVGRKKIQLKKLEKHITVREILQQISPELKEYIEKHPENSIILINGVSIYNLRGLETKVRDEDKISIMPVVGGG